MCFFFLLVFFFCWLCAFRGGLNTIFVFSFFLASYTTHVSCIGLGLEPSHFAPSLHSDIGSLRLQPLHSSSTSSLSTQERRDRLRTGCCFSKILQTLVSRRSREHCLRSCYFHLARSCGAHNPCSRRCRLHCRQLYPIWRSGIECGGVDFYLGIKTRPLPQSIQVAVQHSRHRHIMAGCQDATARDTG